MGAGGNHGAAGALNYFAYNFIKIHRTLRVSPRWPGVTSKLGEVSDLVALLEASESKSGIVAEGVEPMSLRYKLQQRDWWLRLEIGTYVAVVTVVLAIYFVSVAVGLE